jgi:hypothetical protein
MDERLELLALIEAKNQLTFADVDRVIGDIIVLNFPPEHYLYSSMERDKLLWVFYDHQLMMVLIDLLDGGVLDTVDTSSLKYSKNLKEDKAAAKKFTYLLNHNNWVPTVLVKGKNFATEWERLRNDTRQSIDTTIKKSKPSTSRKKARANDLHTDRENEATNS